MAEKIWINGDLVDEADAKISVFDHGLLYGDGVFEGIRLYGGRVFKLRTHLKRLAESARAIRLEIPYDTDQLEKAIRETVAANHLEDGYIRLCVTRGEGTLGLNPFVCERSTVFIIADTIQLYPPEMYEEGMSVVTAATIRNHPAALSPRIKSMNYLNNILAKIEAIDAGVPEAVMLNHEGLVAECTGDNIFIVREDPHGDPLLLTPPLHAGVLEGVTRNTVIDLASDEGITFRESQLTKHDLYTADEMLLTGSAAEVVPVTEVDGRPIGDGTPGPITLRLKEAFDRLVRNDAPED
ncbi:MAG: branched-chain-amino-acid transaminase [Phycisphaeraceae bacterium]|nr:branched-chain-amino-acid transaminase [Phycisphaeraceae bacterium]